VEEMEKKWKEGLEIQISFGFKTVINGTNVLTAAVEEHFPWDV
jgi:hypothetical protein